MTSVEVGSGRATAVAIDSVTTLPAQAQHSAVLGSVRQRIPGWLHRYRLAAIGLDFCSGAVAAIVAYVVRFGESTPQSYLLASLAMPASWVIGVAAARGYASGDLGTGSDEYRHLARAGMCLAGVTALVSYIFKLEVARGFVILAVPTACVVSLALRYLARRNLHARRARGSCLRTVVVVGRDGAVLELARQLRADPHCGMRVVAACVPDPSGADALRAEGIEIAGGLDDAASVVRRLGVDSVAVTSASETAAVYLRKLSWQLEGTNVELLVAPGLMEIAGPRLHIRPFVGLPLLHVQQPEFTGSRKVIKTIFDRTAAATATILLLPVLVVVAVLVRLDSTGPVLFRQERVGRGGIPFTMYKFRTRVESADSQMMSLVAVNDGAGVLFKVRRDPRVTRVGVLLRRYSLDELPQLFNVLLGSMSLVGPRPPLASEVSRYDKDVHRRFLVQPGLTGLWQVSGRSDLSWEETVRLDLRYVENWSFALDAMILWKTVYAVVRSRGAY